MTDWKALAAARCPDIPEENVARLVPNCEALEAALRPLAGQLTGDNDSATVFQVHR